MKIHRLFRYPTKGGERVEVARVEETDSGYWATLTGIHLGCIFDSQEEASDYVVEETDKYRYTEFWEFE